MKYKIAQKNMLGHPIQKDESYLIVGAGISALLLAYHLKKRGISFEIIEKGNAPGGLIKTHYLEGLGLAEQAANGFVWCDELAEVCETLDLEIQQPNAASKARYLVRNNELRQFPLGFFETMGMATKVMFPHQIKLETVADFGNTFFGNTFTNQILEPAFAGIYGAPITDLSFNAVLRPFAEQLNHTNHLPKAIYKWRKQAKSNSNRKKLSGTQSFKGGFGEFPKRLAEYLGGHITYNKELENIPDRPTILTTPSHISQQFFKGDLKNVFDEVSYTPIISTTLFFKKENVKRFKEGFGCLVPRSEGLTVLGILFNSCIFPDRVDHDGLISLTCMLRDYEGNIINQSEKDILDNVLMPDLGRLLGVDAPPVGYKMFKWHKGIPIYNNKLVNAWDEMDSLLKRDYSHVRLLGNYTGQISVRGIGQFIAKGF